jgi:hypothetical protein
MMNGKKRHCRGQEKLVIIVMDCKSIMAPKGAKKVQRVNGKG